jgi:hypothetical protein
MPTAGDVDTTTVVAPLKTDPVTVGPLATGVEGPTDERSGAMKAGRPAGRGTATGVAALASAIGAAIASAVMTPVARAARLLIELMRLWVGKGLLLGLGLRRKRHGVVVDRGIADSASLSRRRPGDR